MAFGNHEIQMNIFSLIFKFSPIEAKNVAAKRTVIPIRRETIPRPSDFVSKFENRISFPIDVNNNGSKIIIQILLKITETLVFKV